MELRGKSALVTGSAHRVGLEIALALARKGCDLTIHFHASSEAALETVRSVEALGARGFAVGADLRRVEDIRSLFLAIDERYGGLDVLVNSASIMQAVDILGATEEDWDRTIDTNLKGAFLCLQEAARRMRRRGSGVIVNIGDIAGMRPWPRFPIHSISKAGVEMLTQVAALALAPEIRVNAVVPGPVLKPERMSDERWLEIGAALPLKRAGTAEHVAEAVIFLLENDFATGSTVVVDGGDHLR
jgi:NAD(P)-dependent dehydrogenase (short-subunit alcohol dehydrogenase family)